MNRWTLVCLALLCAAPSWAHRLDEYLQAVRLAVGINQINLSIELTPGVAVADRLLALIDIDRDGVISEVEQSAYFELFFAQLRLSCDGKRAPLQIVNASFPPIGEMKTGVGVIQIKASAAIGNLTAGAHAVGLTNDHLPAISAYLVNALVPKERAIVVDAQERDVSQKNYFLRFTVKAEGSERRRSSP